LAAQVAARNELGAAFAALGIGLNSLLTAILVPMLVRLWQEEYRKAKLCKRATTT
jgi:putative effector of murein hydrolase